jgi:hypothetical protein
VYGVGLNITANPVFSHSFNFQPVVQGGFNGFGYHFDSRHLVISAEPKHILKPTFCLGLLLLQVLGAT